MNRLYYFIIILVAFSCSKNDNPPSPPITPCISEERVYIGDICSYYSNQNIIVDNYYDGKCLNLVGLIGNITQHTDRITFDLTEAHHRAFCKAEGIECEIKGDNLSREIQFMSTLEPGDLISISGVFHLYIDCTFYSYCMEMEVETFDPQLYGTTNDCNLIYKGWACLGQDQQCDQARYYFVPHNQEKIVYTYAQFIGSAYEYQYPVYTYELHDCQQIELNPINGDPKIIWDVLSQTRDTITVKDNTSSIIYKLYDY